MSTREEPSDPVDDALQLLTAAGLVSAPVIALNRSGGPAVEVTVLDTASANDVDRVHAALSAITHRVVRRPIGFGVMYGEEG